MSKFSLTTSALCALVPVTVLLAGCGGGATPSTLLGDTSSAVTQTIGSFTTRLVGAAQTPVFSQGSGGAVYGLAGASITDLSQSFISKNLSNTKIAFESQNQGQSSIFTMNIDGTNQTRLGNISEYNSEPSWSPDGSKIIFSGFRDGNYEIYTMNADGTGSTRMTNNDNDDTFPSWSSDGSKIVFSSNQNGAFNIWSMNADGTKKNWLTTYAITDTSPSWSPDGSKIVFARNIGGYEIYTMNADGTNQIRLTNNTDSDYDPSWSPDGSKIAFVSNRDGISSIYTMNTDGSQVTRLTNNTSRDEHPSWSPDGSKIVFDSLLVDGSLSLYMMNADGTNPTRLTNSTLTCFHPSWSRFRTPKYVGTGGILATDCAGFLLGKKGDNAFDTSGAGSDSNASVLIFDTPLAARSAARITANTNTDTPGPSLAFTITTSTGLSSVKFLNTTQSLGIIAPTMPTGTTGALVLFSSTTGAVTDVVPYAANRSVGSAPKRVANGDTATYTGSFPAIFDATGKNIAPSGAHSVTLNEKTGQLIRFN
jgi:WD40 repeat protein